VVVAVALSLTLLGPAAALATSTNDMATPVPDAGSVTETPINALPDLPVPVEVPGVPKAPSPVPLPPASKLPPPSTPTSPAPATDAVEEAVHDLGGGAGKRGIETPAEAEGPGVSPGPDARSEPGGRARRTVGRSIDPAETAPLRRWRAYVWPAIALRIGDALAPLLTRLDRLAAVRVPDVFGLLFPSAVPASAGNDLPSKRSGLLGQDLQSPPVASLTEKGMSLLAALLIGLLMAVGLVALARLAVGEELFETGRWRGHRG
jgi:hypothetical protein